MTIGVIEEAGKVAVTVFDVLRELITHSTLGGSGKDRLAHAVDVLDPSVEVTEPEPAAVPLDPAQEIADLKAQLAAAQAPAGPVAPAPVAPSPAL